MDLPKITRGSFITFAVGIAYLLWHKSVFQLKELDSAEYFTAALIGGAVAFVTEWLLGRRKAAQKTGGAAAPDSGEDK